ncbi:hypothetical protein PHMEG_00014148 [Phytophthora megakarya]|uniref:DUSP domain-containing protein n=1 Tax=Phytophthora megakarya TaxID=4795 RepID=A0A225W4P7_9STRA|nr:hypothetical protein PHMEG_00014148 [Phytophthora megakarya]
MSKSKKSALQRAKELVDDVPLEEGDHWFAIATPWWGVFHACLHTSDVPKVRNDSLIDKPLSSKARKVAVLNPKLKEGSDFVFVPETSWDVIARELGCDWEIRREVIYHRTQQQLKIEAYPLAFKIFYWTSKETEPTALVDGTGRGVVVLGSRIHTLGQLLSEVWLAAPDDFRKKFPQFLSGIDSISSLRSTAVSNDPQIRVCFHTARAGDGKVEWVPTQKMPKRSKLLRLRLKPRAKKRQACDDEENFDEEQSEMSTEESEDEDDEHAGKLKTHSNGLSKTMTVKLGEFRLDNRSEVASGENRLYKLLIEQKPHGSDEMAWPSQRRELEWRMALEKGDTLDALDTTHSWFEARLLTAKRNKVHVHYRGWQSKWDEWIPRISSRIAPPYSRVSKWRSALKQHSLVQVGLQVPHVKKLKWRNATVIEVAPSTDEGVEQTKDGSDGVGLRVHVQVDDDDIWLPAHDDLLCESNTHSESSPLTKRERRLLSHDDSLASESSEAPEDVAVEKEGGDGDVIEIHSGEDDDDTSLVDCEGSSSPPIRPPRAAKAARVGPARNLNASFRQVQDQSRSSAGRTPAKLASRKRLSRAQTSSDDTTPEPVSPGINADHVNSHELQTLWTQVGNDLQALQMSWGQLGERLVAFVESSQPAQD